MTVQQIIDLFGPPDGIRMSTCGQKTAEGEWSCKIFRYRLADYRSNTFFFREGREMYRRELAKLGLSEYLAHATLGDPMGERHPGDWPIQELAIALAGAVSDFVNSLDDSSSRREEAWFSPMAPLTIS